MKQTCFISLGKNFNEIIKPIFTEMTTTNEKIIEYKKKLNSVIYRMLKLSATDQNCAIMWADLQTIFADRPYPTNDYEKSVIDEIHTQLKQIGECIAYRNWRYQVVSHDKTYNSFVNEELRKIRHSPTKNTKEALVKYYMYSIATCDDPEDAQCVVETINSDERLENVMKTDEYKKNFG